MSVVSVDGCRITQPGTVVRGNNCAVYANGCVLDGHNGRLYASNCTINGSGWHIFPGAERVVNLGANNVRVDAHGRLMPADRDHDRRQPMPNGFG